jgi:hypothetical protein
MLLNNMAERSTSDTMRNNLFFKKSLYLLLHYGISRVF